MREIAAKGSGAADEERTFTPTSTIQSIKVQVFPEVATGLSRVGTAVWRTHVGFLLGSRSQTVPKWFSELWAKVRAGDFYRQVEVCYDRNGVA